MEIWRTETLNVHFQWKLGTKCCKPVKTEVFDCSCLFISPIYLESYLVWNQHQNLDVVMEDHTTEDVFWMPKHSEKLTKFPMNHAWSLGIFRLLQKIPQLLHSAPWKFSTHSPCLADFIIKSWTTLVELTKTYTKLSSANSLQHTESWPSWVEIAI